MKGKLLALLQAVLVALVMLSGAVALPILFRPFYYWHIAPLNLTHMAGLTTQQVKAAYNAMMDYCIGLTDTFSAGVLPFSESGAGHFADVQKLFVLDLRVLVAAAILLTVMLAVFRKEKLRLLGHTPGFLSAVGLGVSISVVGALAALDFDKAFYVFHKLFFPGKDDWLFDTRTDPVVLMLPEEFFRNCAILIFAVILLGCTGLLLWDCRTRRKA